MKTRETMEVYFAATFFVCLVAVFLALGDLVFFGDAV